MELSKIMDKLKSLGTERTKNTYMSNVFGGQLYATGNYDAMYLAGMISEPKKIAEEVGFKRKQVRC